MPAGRVEICTKSAAWPPVEGFVDLAGAVPGLIGAQGLAEISQVHAHEWLGHSLPV